MASLQVRWSKKSSMEIPAALAWWRSVPGGAEWLDRLPRLAAECAAEWQLRLGPAFENGNVSLVLAVECRAGLPAVLKINFPDEESEHEADALDFWDGVGAVRLFAHDRRRRALLLERCRPGTTLWQLRDEEEANRIACAVLRRLWRRPPAEHVFRSLATEALRWAEQLPREWVLLEKPFERRLIERAVDAVQELVASQGELVVVHQDFHGGNVLRAEREPWLAIDPKPLVGERAFDAASLIRDRREELIQDPAAGQRVRRRLDQLTAELELDRERLRGWGIVHALAWGVSGETRKVEQDMISCARWLASA
jgi:streptomycin 6-kinase